MPDLSHLEAIRLRISNERLCLANAKQASDRTFREHTVMMALREEASELSFLAARGYVEATDLPDMSDDELLASLGAA